MVFGFMLAGVLGVIVADAILELLGRKTTAAREIATDSISTVTRFRRAI
jgi:hypothetical protein